MPLPLDVIAAWLEAALVVVPALAMGAAVALLYRVRRQAKAIPTARLHLCIDRADFTFFLRGFAVLCAVVSLASVRWFVVYTIPVWKGEPPAASDLDDAVWGAIELALVLAPAVVMLRVRVRDCEVSPC